MDSAEIAEIAFEGVPLRVHLSHSDVVSLLSQAGLPLPAIPSGCNTVDSEIQLGELHAIVVHQRGFNHEAADNDNELNGLTLIVCMDSQLSRDTALGVMRKFLAEY